MVRAGPLPSYRRRMPTVPTGCRTKQAADEDEGTYKSNKANKDRLLYELKHIANQYHRSLVAKKL